MIFIPRLLSEKNSLSMKNTISEFELSWLFSEVKVFHLTSRQFKEEILYRVLKEALIAIVYFSEPFLNQERPYFDLTSFILLNIQKSWLLSLWSFYYRYIVIDKEILPYSIMI